ncbi:phosphoribomutase PRM15 [Sporobolomyces salmoneus]|uniref:phosphoribomutase PRM15 n=1 Tax=Sporobolomyces salmoneus TaxID=183962 RepID=UPI0031700CE5
MDAQAINTAVKEWLRLDRNPTTRAEVEQLVATNNDEELKSRFGTRIAFGTAGLRGPMQAGTSSMNDLTILQASTGLEKYARETIPGAKERGFVVGHDHRHNSERFAKLTAGVFRRNGWKVYEFDGLVHTPMVPFATKQLNAAVGVMITASHNPAKDNGYKVYWSNAVQIIPPHDHGIASAILESLEILAEAWEIDGTESKWDGTQAMISKYIAMTEKLATRKEINAKTPLRFTYTAMHGVGLPFAQAAFESFGFSSEQFSVVEEQSRVPDPDFSTVKFPNPEEKGALDLAIRHAEKVGSTIVLANDPDADRFCAAEQVDGKWNVFTGDQIGSLLGYAALMRYKASGLPIDKLGMCASTVSSKMLRSMAEKEGFVFRETLTGFKWIGNEMIKLQQEGYNPSFAYEEAIGFMNGTEIRDKDGVTALAIFAEMAAVLSSEGKTLSRQLDDLYQQYGFHATSNSYFICRDPRKTDRIFSQLRFGSPDVDSSTASSSLLKLPKSLASYPLTSIRDLTIGYDSSSPAPDHLPTLPVDKSSHMISFEVGGDDGVSVVGTVRTSGTEPKIKFYLEAKGSDRPAVLRKLQEVREAVGNEWLRWSENELEKA